jgi:hypothetical protein
MPFPLNVLMVPSSMLTVASYGERLMCSGFCLGKTIRFGSLEFFADYFGVLSLSLLRGAFQRPLPWASLVAGHHPHCRP